RNKYDDERRRLMAAIDRLLHELGQQGRHPRDAFSLVERELSDAVADLRSVGRATRLGWAIRPVLVSVAFGAAAAVTPSLPAAALNVLSGIAINVATGQLRRSPRAGNADYMYLHRTQGVLGISA